MDTEECVPVAVASSSCSRPRSRKRGGSLMSSSSVEAPSTVGIYHHGHDKVLRSHTRRGRGAAGVVLPPIPVSSGVSRRRQRSSGCSSQTDDDDGGTGEVSVSLLNLDESSPKGEEENSNSGSIIITMRQGSQHDDELSNRLVSVSSSCIPSTNETEELISQGGTTKTTTIHSGGIRNSASCKAANNEECTAESRETGAGASSINVPPTRRQQHASSERASPPAPRGELLCSRESRRPNSNGSEDGEDGASVELPARRHTSSGVAAAAQERQNQTAARIVGALSASVTITTVVKCEPGARSDSECDPKIVEKVRTSPSVSVVRVKSDPRDGPEFHKDQDNPEEVSVTLSKLGSQDECRWSGQGKVKDGGKSGRKGVSVSSSSAADQPPVAAMPQRGGGGGGGVSESQTGGGSDKAHSINKVKKSGGSGASKKQSVGGSNTPSLSFVNSNLLHSGVEGCRQSAGVSGAAAGGKKASVPAPMLLMNNLPYMGELTFDTRPRRGRKPKKADICHLISKNYGIHFPAGVTQAAPSSTVPVSSSSLKNAHILAASVSKKGASVAPKSNIKPALMAPAFSNRDVSIVPIIPASWSGPGAVKMGPDSSKSSSVAPAMSMLNPLTCLAQQLMLAQHQKNTPPRCSPPVQSPRGIPSSAQQAISMFPLPRSSSFYGKEPQRGRDEDGVEEEADEETSMEIDVESHRENPGENQDSPLNLCMRDEGGYHEALDVRWIRMGGGGEATSGASKRVVQVKPNLMGAKCSSKRNMVVQGSAPKRNKSGKTGGGPSQPGSSSSYNFHGGNSEPSHVVRCSPESRLPQAASSKLSPNIFAISAHHLQGAEGSGGKGGKSKPGGRKKRESSVRGDMSVAASGSSGAPPTTTGLSSFGGTLFGQSTGGLNDAAEVSICKFKFTGGAKPCLQEKKMLSVDSGGNLRFYSDKTIGGGSSSVSASPGKGCRGQQSQPGASFASGSADQVSGSPPGMAEGGGDCLYALSSLPKSAKSMSMCMPIGTVVTSAAGSGSGAAKSCSTSSKLSLPLLPTPGGNSYGSLSISPTTEELQQLHLTMQESRSSSRISPLPSGDNTCSSSNSCSSSDTGGDGPSSPSGKSPRASSSGRGSGGKLKLKRKRRTRKSLMREKLEKTFKEKGFLIQTQQLESAEGATYCKFRQLRKFTRYLFRSWKDYLPDHVKQISDNSANNGGGGVPTAGQEPGSLLQSGQGIEGREGEEDADIDEDDDDEEEDDEGDSEEPQPCSSLISSNKRVPRQEGDTRDDQDTEEESKNRPAYDHFPPSEVHVQVKLEEEDEDVELDVDD